MKQFKFRTERYIIIGMILLFPFLLIVNQVAYGSGGDVELEEYSDYGGRDDEYDDHDDHDHDHDDEEMEEYLDQRRQGKLRNYSPSVEVAKNTLYLQNCTDCHLGYSRNMLPTRSWTKMMSPEELEDHFGEYVAIEEQDRLAILDYLHAGAAEKSRYRLAQRINRSIKKSETPLRISKVKAIYRKHQDIPDKYISQNEKVRSLSQCTACHQQADRGIFEEDDVYIPYARITANN